MIVEIGDASFKSYDKAIGRVLLFLTNESMTRAAPIYGKSKTISRVCYSSKDAETINISKMMDYAKQIERKTLRLTVVDLKERLVDGDIYSYSWLPTKNMSAVIMTKEMMLPPASEDVFPKNDLDLTENGDKDDQYKKQMSIKSPR